MNKYVRLLVPLGIVLLALIILATATPSQAAPLAAPGPQPQSTPTSLFVSPNERIGIGVVTAWGDITSYDVTQLQAGWFGDWSSRATPPHPNGMEYFPLISGQAGRYPPNWTFLEEWLLRNPGLTWIVGNEPEATYQENHTPAEYAVIYHDVYTFIKRVDPTALVAIGGVIIPSPLRLQWLDMVLQEYQTRYGVAMPVDVWNTHMQIVQEVSCTYDPGNCWGAEIPVGINANTGITMTLSDNANYDLFVQLINGMRTWMKARGFQDKPLIVSEYGVLMPSTYICDCDNPDIGDAMVSSFMTRTFEYMLNTTDPSRGLPTDGNRLVQRWMWYTLNDKPYDPSDGSGFNGSLFDYRNNVYPGTITNFGVAFRNFVAPLKVNYRDLLPSGLKVTSSAGNVFTMTGKIANKGNTGVTGAKVRLYAGDPANGGVPVGPDITASAVGIRFATPATATFTYVAPAGTVNQTFYVVVDPDHLIDDTNRENNTASYTLRLGNYAYRIFLPLIEKNRSVTAQ